MAKEIIDLSGKTDEKDFLLTETLKYLKSLKSEDRSAVVAGVYDQNTAKLFVSTSLQFKDSEGKLVWNHAEFEALTLSKTHGADLNSSIFVSSLSACVKDSGTRAHTSCSETLKLDGFSYEYVGRHDRGAATILQYEKAGLTLNLTQNTDLLLVCDKLYDFFNRFKKNGRNKEQIITDALSFLPKS
ncbi:MAG TPA: hypothetical protein VKC54_02225 [Patescibacteria group bacterium]|nr:hypothetical protein [Patescibacteria group bacterium]